MTLNRKRLVVFGVVVLAVGINAFYDGKIAEFIGNTLHRWQTGETAEERRDREQRRAFLETRYQEAEACPALEDFAREVSMETVDQRGLRAEVLVENVRKASDRELVTDYLDTFQNLAYKESREFDGELERILREYCQEKKGPQDHRTVRREDHRTMRP